MKKICWKLFQLFSFFLVIQCFGDIRKEEMEYGRMEKPLLAFRSDKTFKIAQFADLHYGEGENVWWGPSQDRNSTRVMENVLKDEKPDLVVFSGDQITGNNIHNNATLYWKELVKPCVETNTPWAIVFGNHDDLADGRDGTRKDLMQFDQTFSLSYSQFGPEKIHGVSNYYLPISSSQVPKIPKWILYFLDSGGGSYPEIIYPDQVSWFQNISKTLQKQHGSLPALGFFHIPSQEYANLYSKKLCFGMEDDGVTPQEQNNGIFHAFKQSGDVKAVFVGHDHGNDWCCPTNAGIQLCFGRHTGYGGYGTWTRGARIISIQEDSLTVDTWVRMEDGSKIHGGTFIFES